MSDRLLMKCGCIGSAIRTWANGVKLDPPIPVCSIHDCAEIAQSHPDLTGRTAECSYLPRHHADKPSSYDLAFFEYRGPDSRSATEICKCGYSVVAHKGGANYRPGFQCGVGGFAPVGDQPDKYYCGCKGWD